MLQDISSIIGSLVGITVLIKTIIETYRWCSRNERKRMISQIIIFLGLIITSIGLALQFFGTHHAIEPAYSSTSPKPVSEQPLAPQKRTFSDDGTKKILSALDEISEQTTQRGDKILEKISNISLLYEALKTNPDLPRMEQIEEFHKLLKSISEENALLQTTLFDAEDSVIKKHKAYAEVLQPILLFQPRKEVLEEIRLSVNRILETSIPYIVQKSNPETAKAVIANMQLAVDALSASGADFREWQKDVGNRITSSRTELSK